MGTKLSLKANEILENYLSLPIGNKTNTPYFNNRRARVRFGLRALVGKGTPDDITNEARIISLREKIKIQNLEPDELKKFLVDHGIGIDCSGFVYHILDTECRERGFGQLGKHIKVIGNITRHILAKMRPAENIGVATLSMEKNSHAVKISELKAGDFISVIGAGRDHTYNHVFIVTAVENNLISYAQSYTYPSDGRYGHGVRTGSIVLNNNQDIQKCSWTEGSLIGLGEDIIPMFKEAKSVTLRRLNIFK